VQLTSKERLYSVKNINKTCLKTLSSLLEAQSQAQEVVRVDGA
jgi:hypothetical protein